MKTAILVLLAISAASAARERIVGGTQATKGEFPHIVQIKVGGEQHCGGSIVNANYIVTAAHCAEAPISRYGLMAGEHNLNQNEGTEQFRTVSSITLHPQYNRTTMVNDIAVLRVSEPFSLNENVSAATIPSSSFSPAANVVAAGWGTRSSGGSFPSVLYKVTLPLLSDESCSNSYQGQITAGMLCAGGTTGKAFCEGDDGGPLMSGSTLVGIISWGPYCGYAGYPGVYTSVPYYSNWIRERTR